MRARLDDAGAVGVVPVARVDELDVRSEQPFAFQNFDDALAAGVQRDRQLEATRRVPVAVDGCHGDCAARRRAHAARRHAERQQSVIRVDLPLPMQAFEVGNVHRIVRRRAALVGAVGEAAANARVHERADIGVGVLGAADVVRPVVHRGDARIDQLGAAEPHAAISVLGRILLAQGEHGREIALLRPLLDDIAAGAVPQVIVGVDEPGQRDHVARIDGLRARRRQLPADRNDLAVADMNIAAIEIAQRCVHRQHMRIADDEFAALRQVGRGRGAARARRADRTRPCR